MNPTDLQVVDTNYVAPELAACFVRCQDGEVAVIETGTAHSVPQVLQALAYAKHTPAAVRYVIVTHAHLDHAGGASALLAQFKNATLLAHPRAAKHLVDPARLLASAKTVYGEESFRALYGEIEAIDAQRVNALEDGARVPFGASSFRFLHTRGHANHHFVVVDEAIDSVYTGDTFGLVYPQLQTAGRFALLSTSPTDFDAAEARKSITLVKALQLRRVCLTHFGNYTDIDTIAEQLNHWVDFSEALLGECRSDDETVLEGRLSERIAAELERRARVIGLHFSAEQQTLTQFDARLNAQGLAHVIRKQRQQKVANAARS
jgi:glyoxylase-like metal-dependent hydrolase (beta-lactamase superfamily II)